MYLSPTKFMGFKLTIIENVQFLLYINKENKYNNKYGVCLSTVVKVFPQPHNEKGTKFTL